MLMYCTSKSEFVEVWEQSVCHGLHDLSYDPADWIVFCSDPHKEAQQSTRG